MSTQVESGLPDLDPTGVAAIPYRIRETIRSGNLGSWPVVVVLAIIVIYFGFTADNFFTAVNFNNTILQMAGTTMLAYGVVFVLLIGEIDLSIGFVSGVAGIIVAQLLCPKAVTRFPTSARSRPASSRSASRSSRAPRSASSRARSSH